MAVRYSRQEPSGAVLGRGNELRYSPGNPVITRLLTPFVNLPDLLT